MTNIEFKKKFPGLIGMPDNMMGFFSREAGVVKVKEALQATKKLSIE